MSIKLLSKQVINQISAGEVVEKPASIVKELVENSIDAGATNISIEIKGGGIEYISVTDNGHGIKKDEIKLAFTPHATSKLQEIDDLNSLDTMGFRGEALATISAISKVTMITKTEDQDTGVCVKLEGGEQTDIYEIASVTGTKIEVSNVFYNTPARLKFLRKPKTEENDITNFVEKLILANSNISFKYIIDNKMIYNTIAGSIHNNLYAIYGKDLTDNMLEVNYNYENYSVTGFISKPIYAKANRSYQTLFVNSRFCNNALISSAVSSVYDDFSMKGKFPVYILFLNMPKNEVDVNVHPNKLEVKFENTRKIFMLISNAVFSALSDYNHISKIDEQTTQASNIQIDKQINSQPITREVIKLSEGISEPHKNEYNEALNEYSKSLNNTNKNSGSYDFSLTQSLLSQKKVYDSQNNQGNNKKPVLQEIKLESISQKPTPVVEHILSEPTIKQEDFKQILSVNYKLIGKAFNTYLILEHEDKIYLIDQHAAHERQKYDEILNQLKNNSLKLQDLLIPYTFKTNGQEGNFLSENLDELNAFGIEICEFGYNSYKVSAVPLILSNVNLQDFFNEVFNNLNSFAKSPKEVIKTKFMQMACKSAVKGGDDLSDLEIKTLLNTLKESTEVLLCPHGRPIVVELTKKQIEKWFKRIV